MKIPLADACELECLDVHFASRQFSSHGWSSEISVKNSETKCSNKRKAAMIPSYKNKSLFCGFFDFISKTVTNSNGT